MAGQTFLDAFSHLYKRVCPSVRPSVHPSVCLSVTHELKSSKSAIFDQNYYQYKRGRILCRVSGLVSSSQKRISSFFPPLLRALFPQTSSFGSIFPPLLLVLKQLRNVASNAEFHPLQIPLNPPSIPLLHKQWRRREEQTSLTIRRTTTFYGENKQVLWLNERATSFQDK